MAITTTAVVLVTYKDSHYNITDHLLTPLQRVGNGNILLTDNANLVAAVMRQQPITDAIYTKAYSLTSYPKDGVYYFNILYSSFNSTTRHRYPSSLTFKRMEVTVQDIEDTTQELLEILILY